MLTMNLSERDLLKGIAICMAFSGITWADVFWIEENYPI